MSGLKNSPFGKRLRAAQQDPDEDGPRRSRPRTNPVFGVASASTPSLDSSRPSTSESGGPESPADLHHRSNKDYGDRFVPSRDAGDLRTSYNLMEESGPSTPSRNRVIPTESDAAKGERSMAPLVPYTVAQPRYVNGSGSALLGIIPIHAHLLHSPILSWPRDAPISLICLAFPPLPGMTGRVVYHHPRRDHEFHILTFKCALHSSCLQFLLAPADRFSLFFNVPMYMRSVSSFTDALSRQNKQMRYSHPFSIQRSHLPLLDARSPQFVQVHLRPTPLPPLLPRVDVVFSPTTLPLVPTLPRPRDV